MNPFKLMGRLLGRNAVEPYVAGESLRALQVAPEAKVERVCTVGPNALDEVTPENFEAERISGSIRDYPEDWAWLMKGYKLIHVPSGFVLWVANQDYGLAEVYSNGGKGDFSKPEQAIIWPAVQGWLARHKVGFTGRLPKARITGHSGTFWCYAKEHPWAGVGDSPEEAYRAWHRAVSAQARSSMEPSEYLQVRGAKL